MFLINGLVIMILTCLSMIIPIFIYNIPVYRIKNTKKLSICGRILSEFISIPLILTVIHYSTKAHVEVLKIDQQIANKLQVLLIVVFIIIPFLIELLYNVFIKFKNKIKKFDRIILISLIITTILAIISFLIKNELNIFAEKLIDFNKLYSADIIKEMNTMKNTVKFETLVTGIFMFSIIINFLTYLALNFEDFDQWEISFGWLILYLVPFFVSRIFKLENVYLNIFENIGMGIFTIYGIKAISSFGKNFIKFKRFRIIVAFILVCFEPMLAFLIGVIEAYKNKK